VLLPGAPYRLSEPLWRLQRGAPHLGEDNAAILGEHPSGQRIGA
jgi:benzylsuccinate CoA-transferase BbsE subunit